MTNPTYQVNIFYVPQRATGQQLINIAGVTQSTQTYTSGYYVSVMPEVGISGSGSSYQAALNSILLTATSSGDFPDSRYSSIKTW